MQRSQQGDYERDGTHRERTAVHQARQAAATRTSRPAATTRGRRANSRRRVATVRPRAVARIGRRARQRRRRASRRGVGGRGRGRGRAAHGRSENADMDELQVAKRMHLVYTYCVRFASRAAKGERERMRKGFLESASDGAGYGRPAPGSGFGRRCRGKRTSYRNWRRTRPAAWRPAAAPAPQTYARRSVIGRSSNGAGSYPHDSPGCSPCLRTGVHDVSGLHRRGSKSRRIFEVEKRFAKVSPEGEGARAGRDVRVYPGAGPGWAARG